jgi:hypothetical protein
LCRFDSGKGTNGNNAEKTILKKLVTQSKKWIKMENKNVKKAASLVAKLSAKTALLKAKSEGIEVFNIVSKKLDRAKKEPEKTVRQFCDNLIENRLQKIANAMPDERYSMGSIVRIKCGKFEVTDNRTEEYSKSSKFRATHGEYSYRFSPSELRNTSVIGGLVTYIYPNQRTKVKKCYWFSGDGKKQHWQLKKVDGFICGDFHSQTKHGAKDGFDRNEKRRKEHEKMQKSEAQKNKLFNKALRKQYSYQDSLNAGNCEAGTRAFILRCGLDIDKKYRGIFLLNIANEKSTSSVSFVKKMVNSKIINFKNVKK